jgi:hypothetical protein
MITAACIYFFGAIAAAIFFHCGVEAPGGATLPRFLPRAGAGAGSAASLSSSSTGGGAFLFVM